MARNSAFIASLVYPVSPVLLHHNSTETTVWLRTPHLSVITLSIWAVFDTPPSLIYHIDKWSFTLISGHYLTSGNFVAKVCDLYQFIAQSNGGCIRSQNPIAHSYGIPKRYWHMTRNVCITWQQYYGSIFRTKAKTIRCVVYSCQSCMSTACHNHRK